MSHVYAFGPFSLDPQNELLLRGTHRIHLTAKAHSTLGLLVERAGQLVSKEDILAKVWPDGFVEPANLTQTIYMLRKTLDDAGSELIETVPGKGYRFTAAVTAVESHRNGVATRPQNFATRLQRVAAHAAWVVVLCVAIAAVLGKAAAQHPRQAPPLDPQVSRDYTLGRFYWNERTMPGFSLAAHYFKAALALDPKFALAHSGLADTYSEMLYYSDRSKMSLPRLDAALREAQTAIKLDPNGAEGHASLAFVDELRGPTYRSEVSDEFQRSLALDPGYASAHEWYSWFLFNHGKVDGALKQMEEARDLDPASPAINFAEASQLYFARRFKSASDQWQLAITIMPTSEGYYGAGLADDELGQERKAEREFARALSITPHNADIMAALARAYARDGQPSLAVGLMAEL
ncbi:MAG TPA: winged helix-turn-helix domain-containing protein, partial [Candidatus Acidoferrales bacterium]|nr:winged helix-turn-helix domain-containing protein [Candidatus Acidoferrales bacterium]